jgi:hypothetical protein
VLVKDGKIVCHVGLFPLEVVADGARVTLGGIGGVATLPEKRGKGHMARLLSHVIALMHEKGIPASVLWGDRQRYRPFGWESAGQTITVTLTERSLSKSGASADSTVEEVAPRDAAAKVASLSAHRRFRVERGDRMGDILCRRGNRVWMGSDGYLCGESQGEALTVHEVASLSGRELSLVMAAMQQRLVKRAEVILCSQDLDCAGRLMRAAEYWSLIAHDKVRINDGFKFLKAFEPVLQARARQLDLGNFSLSLGLRLQEKLDVVGIIYESGVLRVVPGKQDRYLEFDARDGVRLLLGHPCAERRALRGFGALLPIPMHIPDLDKV